MVETDSTAAVQQSKNSFFISVSSLVAAKIIFFN